jgi:hypothetical protein
VYQELDRELFIFGEPIETELGVVRFLTYKQYLMNIQELSMISLNVLHIYYQYRKLFEGKDDQAMIALEELKKESLFNIVNANGNFKDAYKKIFALVLDKNDIKDVALAIKRIFEDEKLFMWIRELVMNTNFLTEDEVSPNPEIQKGIERSKRVKQIDAEKQTVSDIISSIVVGASIPYRDVVEMTVLQIYAAYYRLGALYSYNTSTLFATVSSDVSIASWNKHINLFERESTAIERKEFDKQFGDMF